MSLLLNARSVSKTFGSSPLFENVSMTVEEGDRVGLIGPNGSGKSTLLQILAGRVEPDTGEVIVRKGTNLVYVPQNSEFSAGATASSVIHAALERSAIPADEWPAREAETLGRAGFEDFSVLAESLSGGWRKRLAIAEALVRDPDVLLLDEPTNHLDLAGIEWLEKLLVNARFASVTISHDRYFLENVPTASAELNRIYPNEFFYAAGNYSFFLEKKAEFLHAQEKHQEALENRVRIEMEWLRRGPKARTTKSKARIDKAKELIGELSDMRSRSRTGSAGLDFAATGRRTKRLIHLEGAGFGFGERRLFDNLDFTLTAGVRAGLVGANGSGKTTLLRLLRGEIEPQTGKVERADGLRMVYFDQKRQLNPELTLRRALAPDSDSVVFNGRVIHVAAWASRFLFTGEQLNQPVSKLSGGERARVLIANLMLEPADVLLLDEPTNDLDIPTLEILEENLLEFGGALILVTHDRYLLDRVSTVVLGLDGSGEVGQFADYSQCDVWLDERKQGASKPAAAKPAAPKPDAQDRPAPPSGAPKKLSYRDAREYETIEARIAAAEALLESKRSAMQDPAVTSDAAALQRTYEEMTQAQEAVDALYARWSELEEKLA